MSWCFPGSLTRANANQLLAQGLTAIAKGEDLFDGKTLEHFDSSALAVMLAWKRSAKVHDKQLVFQNLPDKLIGLSQVYGIAELLA